MVPWPQSIPDYQWPRGELTARSLLRRASATVLFHLAHFAGRCVHLIRPNTPAIAVIRTDGIGDAVLAEPMMASVARLFADHAVHLWAPPSTCDLMHAAPYVQRAIPIPRGFKDGCVQILRSATLRVRLGYGLGRWKYAAVLYLVHSPEPLGNWLLRSTRARQRWYAPGNLENQFAAQRAATVDAATTILDRPADAGPHPQHDLVRNARLARQWAANIDQCMPTIHVDAKAYAAAAIQSRPWRQTAGWMRASAVIGLMPAASMTVKEYPAQSWAAVANALWHQRRIVCALIGGSADRPRLEELSAQFGGLPHLKMSQPLDLPAMSALIGSLDGLLSVDTGLAHIALAQDVPTVALIGGGHPGRFFPWTMERRAVVLNHAMPCAGCAWRCHLTDAECLTEIKPAQVVAAIAELLDHKIRLPLRAVG